MPKTKPCPMCSTGWIDEDGKPVKPIRKKGHCEFCWNTGELIVLDKEILEDDEGEEQHGRTMGSK